MEKLVLSFGELLLRISPDAEGEWLKQNLLSFYVAGAEANVATALALWGTPSAYFTALPENALSHQLTGYLEDRKVDTSRVLFQGDRMGIFYLPKGKDLKNAAVIYDRAHSSFAGIETGSVDWEMVLDNVGWLHFSAICPALSAQSAKVCEELLQAAVKKGVRISVDLNYRAKLWQYGAQPVDIMPGLVQYCDLIMGNLWAVEKMLGLPVENDRIAGGKKDDYLQHAERTSRRLLEKFPKAAMVANTFRFDHGATGINYYTTLYSDGQLLQSTEYFSGKILDKVGSGDCFMAGLIHGLYNGRPLQDTLEFATAAAFQKLFIASDATNQKEEDIKKFMASYER